MFSNRDQAVRAVAEKIREVRALIQENRKMLMALGKATPEALEELAREDAEADMVLEMVRRVAAGNVPPDERKQFDRHLMHMYQAELMRGSTRPAVLN